MSVAIIIMKRRRKKNSFIYTYVYMFISRHVKQQFHTCNFLITIHHSFEPTKTTHNIYRSQFFCSAVSSLHRLLSRVHLLCCLSWICALVYAITSNWSLCIFHIHLFIHSIHSHGKGNPNHTPSIFFFFFYFYICFNKCRFVTLNR